MMHHWWLIALSIATGVAGQTTLKIGVSQSHVAQEGAGVWWLITLIVQSPWVWAGLALYGIGAVAWIAVLARLELSYAYPFLALNFVLITLTSRFILGEQVSLARWLGIAVICLGILLVAWSTRPQ